MPNSCKAVDFGSSDISCVYDTACFLAMLLDTVVLDCDSLFYQNLCALRNATFEYLPETIVITFPKDT